MYHVYSNCFLNIAAAHSADATRGLYYARSRSQVLQITPCVVDLPGKKLSFVSEYYSEYESETSPFVSEEYSEYVLTLRATDSYKKSSNLSSEDSGNTRDPSQIRNIASNHANLPESEPLFSNQSGSEYSAENDKSLVLYTRGWVFQDWLLAPRVLVFGKTEICWDCSGLHASEVDPQGLISDAVSELYGQGTGHATTQLRSNPQPGLPLRQRWRQFLREGIADDHPYDMWSDIINQYSKRALTRFTDRLVAITGLAYDLGKTWEGVEYLAGLWSWRMRLGLLWYCVGDSQRHATPVPSWSWASVDGEVMFIEKAMANTDGLAEILDATV